MSAKPRRPDFLPLPHVTSPSHPTFAAAFAAIATIGMADADGANASLDGTPRVETFGWARGNSAAPDAFAYDPAYTGRREAIR